MQILALVCCVVAHSDDGMFAAIPNTFDVDRLGQVPDVFFRVQSVVVARVHDASVVKHDIQPTEFIDSALDDSRHLVFLANIALDSNRFDRGRRVGETLLDEIDRFLACVQVDVREDHRGSFRGEEKRTFSANAAVVVGAREKERAREREIEIERQG